MSSYVFVGTEWAGGCPELLNEILRDEWGLRGMVLTDTSETMDTWMRTVQCAEAVILCWQRSEAKRS